MMKNLPLNLLVLLLLAFAGRDVLAQSPLVPGNHVDAQLVAETSAVHPGQDLWVALRLIHQPRWHTYWKNPGDAGKPTEIEWRLPAGVVAGDIVWPTPKRIELPADLVDFGYEDEIFLLTRLSIPADFSATRFEVEASANWLECDDICIPGGAEVSLSLPVQASAPAPVDPQWAPGFAATRATFPREGISVDAQFTVFDGRVNLLVQATDPIFEQAREVSFIPGEHRVFDYNATQHINFQLSTLQMAQASHPRLQAASLERLTGLLLVDGREGRTVYEIDAAPELAAFDFSGFEGFLFTEGMAQAPGLLLIFGFALLGGLILNLMPCVFPVLSLKVMSLATVAARGSRREQVVHALLYSLGIILAFLVLATVLLALQAGGAAIGWGFHLQSPVFVALLVYLFLILGLSLSGVIEIGTGIMGLGSRFAEREGHAGSFFTGVLATVVASPCTAPFMGTALGFALTQGAPVTLAVFAALGLGMALPFLVLALVPGMSRFLPRPGPWMLRIKQVLALPLYATVAWLLWVLGMEAGMQAVLAVSTAGILLAAALWLRQKVAHGRFYWPGRGSQAALALALALSLGLLTSPLVETRVRDAELDADAFHEIYSDARLTALRQEGRPVFVNMTASWCITCLVNERVALSSDTVLAAMQDQEVVYLKGDWTNNDPEITAVLKRYNTSGVPLYLMYPADPARPAEVLPQILTESIFLSAVERATAP